MFHKILKNAYLVTGLSLLGVLSYVHSIDAADQIIIYEKATGTNKVKVVNGNGVELDVTSLDGKIFRIADKQYTLGDDGKYYPILPSTAAIQLPKNSGSMLPKKIDVIHERYIEINKKYYQLEKDKHNQYYFISGDYVYDTRTLEKNELTNESFSVKSNSTSVSSVQPKSSVVTTRSAKSSSSSTSSTSTSTMSEPKKRPRSLSATKRASPTVAEMFDFLLTTQKAHGQRLNELEKETSDETEFKALKQYIHAKNYLTYNRVSKIENYAIAALVTAPIYWSGWLLPALKAAAPTAMTAASPVVLPYVGWVACAFGALGFYKTLRSRTDDFTRFNNSIAKEYQNITSSSADALAWKERLKDMVTPLAMVALAAGTVFVLNARLGQVSLPKPEK